MKQILQQKYEDVTSLNNPWKVCYSFVRARVLIKHFPVKNPAQGEH